MNKKMDKAIPKPGRARAWLIVLRPFALPWMAVNTLFGASLAAGGWPGLGAWLHGFLIVSLVLLFAHLVNALRDFALGLDKIDDGSAAKPYTAGCQVIPRGWLSAKEVWAGALVLLALSLVLLALAPLRLDVWILYTLGVAMAATYTDFFKPHGLGEVALFLGHGFAATTLAYTVLRPLTFQGLSAGVLMGLWAGLVYTVDQWQDTATDFLRRASSLAFLVVKGEMKVSQIWFFLVTAAYVTQVGTIMMGMLPAATLVSVFILPLCHVAGILLDAEFDKGVFVALVCMWAFALLCALGIIL
ncbi:MAG: prenyltransferase [Deltaproteobacteria bacterium]|nr:prenyltransferase [Deltaproteobacteria bacterium]